MTNILNKNLHQLTPFYSHTSKQYALNQNGGFSGVNLMPLKKVDTHPDFARKYSHGDPTKYIDWNFYARSDQLIVREKKEDTNININIGVDFNCSMFWPNQSIELHLSRSLHQKIEIAFRILLNLAYQHLKKGNQVNIWLISKNRSSYYQPKNKLEIISFFNYVVEQKFSKNSLNNLFHEKKFSHSNNDVSYWIGDGFSNIQNYFLQHSKYLYFFQILSSLEINVDWLKNKTYYFENSNKKIELTGSDLKKKNYLNREIKKWQTKITKELNRKIRYVLLTEKSLIKSYIQSLDPKLLLEKKL